MPVMDVSGIVVVKACRVDTDNLPGHDLCSSDQSSAERQFDLLTHTHHSGHRQRTIAASGGRHDCRNGMLG